MNTNIRVVLSDGMTGEVYSDSLMNARCAEVFSQNILNTRFGIVTVRQNDSGRVLQQVGKGGIVSVPVCPADYPAYTVDITI